MRSRTSKQFTQSDIADPSMARKVTLGLSGDSRQEADELAARAVAARGRAVGDPVDQGPSYFDMSATAGR
jgi:predicted lactoylglutathione lyase